MIQPAFGPSGLPVPIINADDIRRRSLTRSVIAALVVVQDATGGIVVVPAMPGTSLDVGQMVEVVGRVAITARGVVRRVRAGAGLEPTGVTNLRMKPFTADTLAARSKEIITGTPEADG